MLRINLKVRFDGDQVALYMPMSEEAQNEARENIMFSEHNFIDPVNDSVIYNFDQDLVLGLYQIYKSEAGRGMLIKTFMFPDKDKINKTDVNNVIYKIAETGNMEKIKQLMDISLRYLTYKPISVTLDSFYYEDILKTKRKIKDDVIEKSIEMENKLIEEIKPICKLKDIIESGSRGNWNNIKQMCIRRGYISDAFNNVVRTPIKSALIEGLSEDEVFTSSHGARKGLIDTAENVSVSGYLTRRLVYLGSNCRLSKVADII